MAGIEVDTSGLLEALTATVQQQQTKVASDLYAGLIRVSPVVTGRLRNGWQMDNSDELIIIENNVEYCGWVMEDGTVHISAKHLITGEIMRVTST